MTASRRACNEDARRGNEFGENKQLFIDRRLLMKLSLRSENWWFQKQARVGSSKTRFLHNSCGSERAGKV